MENEKALSIRLFYTGIVTLIMWGYLTWDYSNGGVPKHFLYIFENLPGISNWWGGLVIPLLTWFSLGRIHKRFPTIENVRYVAMNYPKRVIFGFLGALFLGILVSIFFTYGNNEISALLILTLLPLSFFIPLYHAEYLLGFVLGMTHIFGPILPIGIGIVLMILFTVVYKLIRPVIHYFTSLMKG